MEISFRSVSLLQQVLIKLRVHTVMCTWKLLYARHSFRRAVGVTVATGPVEVRSDIMTTMAPTFLDTYLPTKP